MSVQQRVVSSIAYVVLAASGCATSSPHVSPSRVAQVAAPAPTTSAAPPSEAVAVRFAELIAPGSAPGPSELAQGLVGQRVRMVGFMAQLEQPLAGAFYLTPRPVSCDEAGAGTGDLPIESVLVSVPFMADAPVPHVDGALEVTGRFETGARVDAAGNPSSFRIRLDGPSHGQLQRAPAAAN